MNAEGLLQILIVAFPWIYTKIAIIILLLLYLVFAAVIVRQEQLMTKVVMVSTSQFLKIIAWGHFIASLVILLLSLIIL